MGRTKATNGDKIMTTSMKQLYVDALRAGWLIETGTQVTFLVKRNKRTGKIYAGLVIYPDGTAFDVMVQMDVARGLRSYKDMRSVLGICNARCEECCAMLCEEDR